MKQYKLDIIDKLNERAKGEKIIGLRETALMLEIKHLKKQECLEIAKHFLQQNLDYKVVRYIDNPLDSLFCSLYFIDKTLEFDDCEEI